MNSHKESLSCWFGLSYASWLTLPRVLMVSMPEEWQKKMALLLNEYNETFPNQPKTGTLVITTVNGKFTKTPGWLLNYRYPDKAEINKLRPTKATG